MRKRCRRCECTVPFLVRELGTLLLRAVLRLLFGLHIKFQIAADYRGLDNQIIVGGRAEMSTRCFRERLP